MLSDFVSAWLDKDYYVWGAGKQGGRLVHHLGDKINIKGFIDSDTAKQGSTFHGYPIYSFEQVRSDSNLKILITSLFAAEIMEKLKSLGLFENVDYCDWKKLLSVYYWYKHKQLYMYRGNLTITPKCTLKCEHCNMLVPFHKNPAHLSICDLKSWIDNYFAYVDYVTVFDILGGEPFLHPDIEELTDYLGGKWGERIGELQFFTNGTITPNDSILKTLKKYDVEMIISDYRDSVSKVGPLIDRFVSALKRAGVRYRLKYFDTWVDFGYPHTRRDDIDEMKAIFKNCGCATAGIYRNRLYFCNAQVGAEILGDFTGKKSDWVELAPYSENNKQRFFEFDSGVHPLGYVSFCGRCDGIGPLNKNFVPVAKQATSKQNWEER